MLKSTPNILIYNSAFYRVGIRSISDYSPFGVQLSERTISAEYYRFGFQGQEHDDEVKGAGNSVNYTYRMHDPRLGRFFAIDPLTKKYPHYTPYSFSGNRVINSIEREGQEEITMIVIGSTVTVLTNVLPQNVAVAMSGVDPSQSSPPAIGAVPPSATGAEVDVTVMSAIIIWDPTARLRPNEAGMIRYIGVAGVGNEMRGLTPQELAIPFIQSALSIGTGSAEFQEKLDLARPTSLSGGINSANPTNNNDAEALVNLMVYRPPITFNTNFVPNTTTLPLGGLIPADLNNLGRLAGLLNSNPAASVNLAGNTMGGGTTTPATPVGGTAITFGALSTGRANVIANMLTSPPYNVNPAQVGTGIGNLNSTVTNVTANTVGTGGTAPNNGNRIDFP